MKPKRALCILGVVAVAALLALLSVLLREPQKRHPVFGAIERARMADPGYHTPLQKRFGFMMNLVPVGYSDRLMLDTNEMFWRSINNQSAIGSITFDVQGRGGSNPTPGGTYKAGRLPGELAYVPPITASWEFAPCSRDRLQDLEAEDLRVRFVFQGDPSGQELFGMDYWTNAIQVTVGDVLLARKQTDPSTIYAIQIAAQEGDENFGYVEIEYLRIPTGALPNPAVEAAQPRPENLDYH